MWWCKRFWIFSIRLLYVYVCVSVCVCVCVCVCCPDVHQCNCVKGFVVSDSESKSCSFFPQPPFCTQDQQMWAEGGKQKGDKTGRTFEWRPWLELYSQTVWLTTNVLGLIILQYDVVKDWKDFANMMDNSSCPTTCSWDAAFMKIGMRPQWPLTFGHENVFS